MLNRIASNAQKMDTMMHAILEYSRVGRKQLQKEKVNVYERVQSALSLLEQDIHNAHARIQIQEGLPEINQSCGVGFTGFPELNQQCT